MTYPGRHKDAQWTIPDPVKTWDHPLLAVMMDLRDELKSINSKLACWRVSRAMNDINSMGVAMRRRQRKTKRSKHRGK